MGAQNLLEKVTCKLVKLVDQNESTKIYDQIAKILDLKQKWHLDQEHRTPEYKLCDQY